MDVLADSVCDIINTEGVTSYSGCDIIHSGCDVTNTVGVMS